MENRVTLCLLFIISCFLTINFVIGKGNGLTIKLIHRDSSESPFYKSNLTYTQQIERFVNQSKARLKRFSTFPTDLRSKIIVEEEYIFSTQIGIGTFSSTSEPFKSYYFVVDSGSALTWVECRDCKRPGNHCFCPTSQPFPNMLSSSYKKLLCNPPRGKHHPICNPKECIGPLCAYKIKYYDNSTTKGFLASETFTFDTTFHSKERVSNLVFGCGIDMINTSHSNVSKISGLLGLGWGPESFVTQLGAKSNGKFSYCLGQNINTFLHFGDNIPKTRAIYSTPLLKYPNDNAYFVNLKGIIVSGKHLNLTENDFARKPNNTGGCVIDSGAAISHIVNHAFVKIKESLIEYFDHVLDFVRVQIPTYELCYKRNGARQGFKDLPTITFQFQGADIQIKPQNLFFADIVDRKERFCLAILPNDEADHLTAIGAYQQRNIRFVYLTREKMLRFGPENCKANV